MEQRNVLSPGQDDGIGLIGQALRRLLAESLDSGGRGDAGVEAAPAVGARPPRPAAVLVPLVRRGAELTVLLTQRTAHLAHHPGQISFPGGRLEEHDCGDPVRCALRETEEEVGLSRDRVMVVGRLDDYVTGTGFMVTPVVGLVSPPFELRPDPFEVADVFEVPLDFLIEPANRTIEHREVGGLPRPYWAIAWQERVIWGATAGMLVNLSEAMARRVG